MGGPQLGQVEPGVAGHQRVEGPGDRRDPAGQGPGPLVHLEREPDPAVLASGRDPGDVGVQGRVGGRGEEPGAGPDQPGARPGALPSPPGERPGDVAAGVGQRPQQLAVIGGGFPWAGCQISSNSRCTASGARWPRSSWRTTPAAAAAATAALVASGGSGAGFGHGERMLIGGRGKRRVFSTACGTPAGARVGWFCCRSRIPTMAGGTLPPEVSHAGARLPRARPQAVGVQAGPQAGAPQRRDRPDRHRHHLRHRPAHPQG